MNVYTENEKTKDFDFFKNINEDFFSKNGHKFLAIRNQKIIDNAETVQDLIKQMNSKSFDVGTYLIQECTGDNSAFVTSVMRLMMKANV